MFRTRCSGAIYNSGPARIRAVISAEGRTTLSRGLRELGLPRARCCVPARGKFFSELDLGHFLLRRTKRPVLIIAGASHLKDRSYVNFREYYYYFN